MSMTTSVMKWKMTNCVVLPIQYARWFRSGAKDTRPRKNDVKDQEAAYDITLNEATHADKLSD